MCGGDQPQDVGEQIPRNGDLGNLERDVAAVADDLHADRYGGVRRITQL
jgi:hypothetical protein